jgi:uncharacterized protein (TIGR02186 family)
LLSSHHVLFSSNYTGSSVVLFGAIQRDAQTVSRGTGYDIAVTVRGPRQFLVVRKKERFGPVWINQEQQKFPMTPAYLSVQTSRPIDGMTSPELRSREKVGLSAIVNAPDFTNQRDGADAVFREALTRLKTQEGLYLEDERGVTFLTPTIFRASIPLPATAAPGDYDVEVVLLTGTVILARMMTHFEMVKTGVGETVGELAHDWSAAYGLAIASLALLFGWLANMLFRRD